jgi:hypothetical protein
MKTTKHLLLILLSVISSYVLAQDPPARPSDIKVAEYDAFKNNSFDLLTESTKLKDNVTAVDKDVKNYAGVIKTVEKGTLFKDLKSLKNIKDSGASLTKKVADIDNQSKDLLANAKKAGLKAPAATKNTKTSVTALDNAKGHLSSIKDLAESDIKLIQDELKSRGEPIE